MSNLSHKIWYGSFHQGDDIHRPHLLPGLVWAVFLMAAATIRMRLPFLPAPSLEVHSAILESLTAGQIWGRQALVGSPEYPPLATLAMFAAQALARTLRLPTGQVLVALAQVWALFYLLRIPRQTVGRVLTAAIIVLLMIFHADARQTIYRVDPNWVVAIPAACGFYHFVLWCRSNSLRDIVLLGINCGLLAFAGPVGMLLAFLMLLVVSIRLLRPALDQQLPGHSTRGLHLLAWTPLLYSVGLIVLANWLIMGSPLFFIHRFWQNLALLENISLASTAWDALGSISWLVIGGLGMAVIELRHRCCRPWAAIVAVSLAGLFMMQIILNHISYYAPGSESLILILALAGILMPFWKLEMAEEVMRGNTEGAWWLTVEAGVIGLFMILGIAAPRAGLTSIDIFQPQPPERREIIRLIEKHTPETRAMVYGLQTPARFDDLQEQRFVARLEFDRATVAEYAEDEEYFYLLVPPNNGKFYSPSNPLADLHRRGRPWLVLEKNWPGDWQLWRVLHPAVEP